MPNFPSNAASQPVEYDSEVNDRNNCEQTTMIDSCCPGLKVDVNEPESDFPRTIRHRRLPDDHAADEFSNVTLTEDSSPRGNDVIDNTGDQRERDDASSQAMRWMLRCVTSVLVPDGGLAPSTITGNDLTQDVVPDATEGVSEGGDETLEVEVTSLAVVTPGDEEVGGRVTSESIHSGSGYDVVNNRNEFSDATGHKDCNGRSRDLTVSNCMHSFQPCLAWSKCLETEASCTVK